MKINHRIRSINVLQRIISCLPSTSDPHRQRDKCMNKTHEYKTRAHLATQAKRPSRRSSLRTLTPFLTNDAVGEWCLLCSPICIQHETSEARGACSPSRPLLLAAWCLPDASLVLAWCLPGACLSQGERLPYKPRCFREEWWCITQFQENDKSWRENSCSTEGSCRWRRGISPSKTRPSSRQSVLNPATSGCLRRPMMTSSLWLLV